MLAAMRMLARLLAPTLGAYAIAGRYSDNRCLADADFVSGHEAPSTGDAGGRAMPSPSGGGVGGTARASLDGAAAALLHSLDNQVTAGGLALMAVGASLALARSAGLRALTFARRRFMVTAEIDSRDDAYRWVMLWLARSPQFANSPVVSVSTSLASFGTSAHVQPAAAGAGGSGSGSGDADAPQIAYLPAPGDHLVRHEGRWLWVSRRRTNQGQVAANARLLLETLHISSLGTSRAPLESLLAAAAAGYRAAQHERTAVFAVDADGWWTQVGTRPRRPLSTVVLPGKEALRADAAEFLASEAWYAHRGVPWRRGYLLHGAPGTGKTSLAMALAGELGLPIYVVTLSSPSMHDEALRQLLNSAAPRALLLLEDVDAAFVGRTAATDSAATTSGRAATSGGLSFSGLLNAIDGVAAQEGRLLMMTTNHADRLSAALTRPGRVDVRVEFRLATRAQVRDLFVAFYSAPPPAGQAVAAAAIAADDDGEKDAVLAASAATSSFTQPLLPAARLSQLGEQFAARVPEGRVSMAALQGCLTRHKRDAEAAVRGVAEFAREAGATSRSVDGGDSERGDWGGAAAASK